MKAQLEVKGAAISLAFSVLIAVFLSSGCGAAAPTPANPSLASTATKPAIAATPMAVSSPPAGTTAKPATVPTPAPNAAMRKPSGQLVVQQPSLRNVPMIPELGGAGLNVYENLMYDYLTVAQFDQTKGQYVSTPGLSTRWESTPDFKTWTFYLRKGVQWQDGYGEFTGEDVKYTIENIVKNPKVITTDSAILSMRRIVDSVEAVDPYTVVFHMAVTYGTLDSMLSDIWNVPPVSKRYLEKVGIDEANKKPVGTGPYKLAELKVGEFLRFEALDQHWRQIPYYKTIIFKEVAETSTAVAMLKTGDADIIVAPIPLKDEIVAAGYEARLNPGTEYTYAMFSGLWDPTIYPKETDLKVPWRDIRVREAMNISIDRAEIIKSLYKGQAQASPVILFMPGSIGYNPDLKPYPYDPARAKKLLADAGYSDGFEFNLPIYPWTHAPEIPDLGQVLGSYWSKVGLRGKMSWSEFPVLSSAVATRKDPRMVMPRGSTRMVAPEVHLDTFFNPKGQAGIAAADIWDLTQKMEGEGDPAKKDALGRTIAARIYDGYWMVPVAWSSMPFFVNPKKVGDWPFLRGKPEVMRLEYLKHPGDQ